MTTNDGEVSEPTVAQHEARTMGLAQPSLADRQRTFFLFAGLIFLATGLVLFLLTGYLLYQKGLEGTYIDIRNSSDKLSPADVYNFYGAILNTVLVPMICLSAALICSSVGIRLLRAVGITAAQVISAQDYPILAPAISAGNEQAITQYIRLSSLSGVTGTFTKVGLSGLPLATIALTIFLSLAGLVNSQYFDLAKLTLGAFLGSFVQRQSDFSIRPSVGRQERI
jgi:hypothetical protein